MYSQKDYKLDLDSVHNDFARKILTAKIKKRHQEHLENFLRRFFVREVDGGGDAIFLHKNKVTDGELEDMFFLSQFAKYFGEGVGYGEYSGELAEVDQDYISMNAEHFENMVVEEYASRIRARLQTG